MNELQKLFDYQGKQVRVVMISEDPFFVAKDVCEVLELDDVSKAISRLDDDEKGTTLILTPGGTQEMLIANEPGLYSLVLSSRKPEAKAFKRWITHEVLPAIRKTGTYLAQPQQLTKLEILELAIASEKKVLELQAAITEQKPKVVFAESVECSKTSTLIKGLSVILSQNGIDIGQNRLFEWMRQEGYLCRQQGKNYNKPTQKSLDLKIMQEKTTTINRPDREPIITNTPLITGKGLTYFVNKFLVERVV